MTQNDISSRHEEIDNIFCTKRARRLLDAIEGTGKQLDPTSYSTYSNQIAKRCNNEIALAYYYRRVRGRQEINDIAHFCRLVLGIDDKTEDAPPEDKSQGGGIEKRLDHMQQTLEQIASLLTRFLE